MHSYGILSASIQSQIITKYNYPEETHKVRTADGYILTVHRIPHHPTEPPVSDRPAVLLLHGLLGSSADWVIAGPHKGLGKANRRIVSRIHAGRSISLCRKLEHTQVLKRANGIKFLDLTRRKCRPHAIAINQCKSRALGVDLKESRCQWFSSSFFNFSFKDSNHIALVIG
jgi:hypothetical protein